MRTMIDRKINTLHQRRAYWQHEKEKAVQKKERSVAIDYIASCERQIIEYQTAQEKGWYIARAPRGTRRHFVNLDDKAACGQWQPNWVYEGQDLDKVDCLRCRKQVQRHRIK